MGTKTIVQATAGPEFLELEGYGGLQGTFAGISFVVQAATPLALAVIWAVMGSYNRILWILLASAMLSATAFLAASQPDHGCSATKQLETRSWHNTLKIS